VQKTNPLRFHARVAQALRTRHTRPSIARVDFEARLGELTFIVGRAVVEDHALIRDHRVAGSSDGEVGIVGSIAGRLPANQRILFSP